CLRFFNKVYEKDVEYEELLLEILHPNWPEQGYKCIVAFYGLFVFDGQVGLHTPSRSGDVRSPIKETSAIVEGTSTADKDAAELAAVKDQSRVVEGNLDSVQTTTVDIRKTPPIGNNPTSEEDDHQPKVEDAGKGGDDEHDPSA
ncbi:hypothetical protein BGW39_003538, partial [Mortierella sp. 14UC]